MRSRAVKVPGSLLLDRDLAQSSKLLWMILQLGAPSDHQALSSGLGRPVRDRHFLRPRQVKGLGRHTVVRGLTQLESAGWLTPGSQNPGAHTTLQASVPGDLLLETRIGMAAKLLYGTLQLTPGFRTPAGRFTYADLSCLGGASSNTIRQAVNVLERTGWLQTSRKNRRSPIHFTLRNPAVERQQRAVAQASRRLEEAPFLGEALMREYLSLIVYSDEYEDNASPGFLVNPFTGEEMQLDRYYPPRVAFEFNGPQHYGPTEMYANEEEARKQQGRDHIKLGICTARGITLVVVHPEGLTLEELRRKVGALLPLRDLDGHELLIAHLESVSRAYRRKARRDR